MLSIIILCHNCLDFTKQCIESIRENTQDYELVIIDNGSTDETKDWLRSQNRYNCEIISDDFSAFDIGDGVACLFDENLGFAGGNNKGIKIASGDYICFLNNDTIVTPGWADTLIDHLEDGFDLIGPCTNSIAGLQKKRIGSYKDKYSLYDEAITFCDNSGYDATDVNWIIGYCIFISSENLEKLGGFDERFLIGNSEDIDFCFRAKDLGMTIGIAEDCYIHHFGSQTFKEMQNNSEYDELIQKNHNVLVEKWGKDRNYNQLS